MTVAVLIIALVILLINIFVVVRIMTNNNDLTHFKDVFQTNLEQLNTRFENRLGMGEKATHQTFVQVVERLTKIDEAQKKMQELGANVTSLQHVLTDKKTRGIFGEVQLTQILHNVFGEQQGSLYELQSLLSNGKIVDALLKLPEPIGKLAVDSKFPLENYRRMVDLELTPAERDNAKKEFVRNVKKHIDDISTKYIIKGETSEQAMMFVPAEAIFAEIHAYHNDIVEYSIKKSVWITSPTTFMATMSTIQSVITNIERNKHMSVVHDQINKLGDDFKRFQSRWDDLAKHMSTVNKDVEKLHTSSEKITAKFDKILSLESVGRSE